MASVDAAPAPAAAESLRSPTRPRSPSPPASANASLARPPAKKARTTSNGPNKKTFKANPKSSKKQKRKNKGDVAPEPCSPEDVLRLDIVDLLGAETVEGIIAEEAQMTAPFEFKEELEVTVSKLSSTGEGLARAPEPRDKWVLVIPFCLPGEKVKVRVYRHARLHSRADLLEVLEPNTELRDMSRVGCKYFAQCAGCQYQELSYEKQLELKRNVVVKAYTHYANVPADWLPEIGTTLPSPEQYGYRTKITPHFNAPPKAAQRDPPPTGEKPEWMRIGFNRAGTQNVMDIEDCPIATPIIRETYGPMREEIHNNIMKYKKGVSLILRDSIDHTDSSDTKHVAVTSHKGDVREKVGDKVFEYPAHSFFQNNNSVLTPLTTYVRDALLPAGAAPLTHLVDTYCGAGLFAITLAAHFATVAGIELSPDSIRSATRNAALNGLPADQCTFRAGDAADIFSAVKDFPAAQTAVVIDPPRKGCDEPFLRQLVDFRPAAVVYVSCNVHTQARDVGWVLREMEKLEGPKYTVESVRGFDLFPQTAHVESVAVLRLSS
ncbi:S-adenosyl-L-methionine-dependent methyltransferase [Schizophyllum amplum]|uniref:S-adenosyl-L-methionine-dependent methyltransferase n=1 Tax=Schizophyllum amplum TaxID=97359 RepID=A0A550CDF9_9AGAR|nr:S-adenosyl-L-methionine-dependent methyltransferase [Auriculariopsis ampla]